MSVGMKLKVLTISLPAAFLLSCNSSQSEPGLIGYWNLQGNARDYSGQDNHGNHGVKLDGRLSSERVQ